MKLNDVIKETGLTKKAIYFYEEMGLISPEKDRENNYREYTIDDVNSLSIVSALRRLDFSVKEVRQILAGKESPAEAVKRKLKDVGNEILRLQENKKILEQFDLNGAPDLDALKDLAERLDGESKNISGYMQKELDRIMPGNVGKMFAIHYGQFLDEPLDTEAKEEAWRSLIGYLDAQEELEYPEDIREIVEQMYGKISENDWIGFGENAQKVTDGVMNQLTELGGPEKEELERRIQEYNKTSEYQRFLKLQKYMVENLQPFFRDVEKYMNVLSSRFVKFNTIVRSAALRMQE